MTIPYMPPAPPPPRVPVEFFKGPCDGEVRVLPEACECCCAHTRSGYVTVYRRSAPGRFVFEQYRPVPIQEG